MQYRIDSLLVKQLHAFVYGNGKEYFLQQSAEDQKRLLKMAVSQEIEPLFYQMLQNDLPANEKDDFKSKYLAGAVGALKDRVALKRFTDLLEKHTIRFALFKGADMAFRYYPNPALRSYRDWDVLIHPDDIERAVAVLQDDGFQCDKKTVLSDEHHHLPVMIKNDACVELHKTFSCFDGVEIAEVWKYLNANRSGSMQYHLTPEINLMQMTRHIANNGYMHAPLVKFLLDAAYLMAAETIDWQHLKKLAKNWHMPYPGDVLGAWGDFFPADVLSLMNPDSEKSAGFRQLFDSLHTTISVAAGEWDMQHSDLGKMAFICRGLRRMSAAAVRKKYALPEQGAYCRLIWWYSFDLIRKFFRFVRYCLMPDKNVLAHGELVAQLEKNNDKK